MSLGNCTLFKWRVEECHWVVELLLTLSLLGINGSRHFDVYFIFHRK